MHMCQQLRNILAKDTHCVSPSVVEESELIGPRNTLAMRSKSGTRRHECIKVCNIAFIVNYASVKR